MARFFNDEENAIMGRRMCLRAFSDLMYAELSKSTFGEKAPEALAKHLNIKADDVYEWLRGESLPCRDLLFRLVSILRGDNFFPSTKGSEIETSSWSKVIEFVREVENVQQLQNVKLTRQLDS